MSFPLITVQVIQWLGFAMGVVWLISLAKKDASIVDIFWPLGFVIVAAVSWHAEGYRTRREIVALLVIVWALRLAVHLAVRNLPHGEDPRYRSMRRRHGKAFWWRSLFTVFALQYCLLWIVSLPIQVSMLGTNELSAFDAIGIVLCVAGFFVESIGDLQLTRFKADPANQGRVMDRGLWRYTRHPNYFGDAVFWWGMGLIAVGSGTPWALAGPFVMNVLLLRVSGVALLERRMKRTRPSYEEYVRRTSAFVPMPPKG